MSTVQMTTIDLCVFMYIEVNKDNTTMASVIGSVQVAHFEQ